MSNNFGYIDIILLAMIAGFIILRLRNILGRRTGHEEKIYSDYTKNFDELTKKNFKPKKSNLNVLEGEEKEKFLKGAEVAYETIITSFAKGEQNKLDSLLTKDMARSFSEAINQRNKNNIKSELTFIGFKESKLEKYEKIKTDFIATVKFVSEIISVKKDKDNKVIEGNPDRIKTVTDHWKFTKNIFSKNPNWYLAEIITK
ncbi:MAG: Tim44/TimA family putative adaptor protein [Pseudomonadota bacterium]|nr:Tim44/TimA family putative adaptor protein [Pseudomonadota bacterium]